MNKRNNFQFFFIFIVFMIVLLGIGKYFIDIIIQEEGLVEDSDKTELITVTEDRKVSWEEITIMLDNCEVEQVSQTHDLQVSVVTDNGQIFWSEEPQIDDILKLASEASESCDMEIIQITE